MRLVHRIPTTDGEARENGVDLGPWGSLVPTTAEPAKSRTRASWSLRTQTRATGATVTALLTRRS